MHKIIAENREAISELCRRYGVRRLEVFGSAARGVDFDPKSSDADFLVQYLSAPKTNPLDAYFGLRDGLSALLGLPVDLIEAGAVKNPFVLAQIDRRREPIYVA